MTQTLDLQYVQAQQTYITMQQLFSREYGKWISLFFANLSLTPSPAVAGMVLFST
jgi:hypothetical protein